MRKHQNKLQPRKIDPLAPTVSCGKTRLLHDYEGVAGIGLASRIRTMGPLRMRQCIKSRRVGVKRSQFQGTRASCRYCEAFPYERVAMASGNDTNDSQEHSTFNLDEDSLKVLQNTHRNIDVETYFPSPPRPSQDGKPLPHEQEHVNFELDTNSLSPGPLAPSDYDIDSDQSDNDSFADVSKVESDADADKPYLGSPATS